MRKAVSPKKLVHYAIVVSVVWIAYRFYLSYQAQQEGHFRPYGPRDLRGGRQTGRVPHDADRDQVQPVDLDKRLQEIQKEIDRQKRLQSQREQYENDKNVGQQHLDEFENDWEDDLGRGKQERKDVQDTRDDVLREGENSLHGARNGQKNSEHDNDLNRASERKDGVGGGGKGQVLSDYDDEEVEEVPQPARDTSAKKKDSKKEFQVEKNIDWALEEELQKRRKKFQEEVAKRKEEYNPEDFKNMYETDDHLAFVTAGSDSTWPGLLQFIYSIQYFYPNSDMGIFDIGLSKEHKDKLKTFCNVNVMMTFMDYWPEHMRDPAKKLWRPMVWQMGLAAFGHIVYVEPDRFLSAKNMKHYIEHSRRAGFTAVGHKLKYSPFVVTNPEMYYFFNVDTRKLQRVNMFEITMLIMHNSEPVRQEFMRHLVSCALEEYCIAPPDSTPKCDHRLFAGSKKYAGCHRYEMSAVNILLNKWFQFKLDDFLVKDIATKHYDGSVVVHRIKTCAPEEKEEM